MSTWERNSLLLTNSQSSLTAYCFVFYNLITGVVLSWEAAGGITDLTIAAAILRAVNSLWSKDNFINDVIQYMSSHSLWFRVSEWGWFYTPQTTAIAPVMDAGLFKWCIINIILSTQIHEMIIDDFTSVFNIYITIKRQESVLFRNHKIALFGDTVECCTCKNNCDWALYTIFEKLVFSHLLYIVFIFQKICSSLQKF
mgnify:CR=1 FL=1